ncbi:MAG: DUF4445 domain-containing protein [Clostridia bacterium]|nr:DUF4445 domain-containing protein [Clostridia bacterium]MBQ4157441.1 DUF4445 domain-containing protein [Clostridia bacterium]
MEWNVTVNAEGKEAIIKAQDGEILLQALSRAGIEINAPCGGRGVCQKCLVRAEGKLIKEKPSPEGTCLACKTRIAGDVKVWIDMKKSEILSSDSDVFTNTDHEKGLALAADIGTTTIAAYLIDLESGKTLGVDTRLNPQRNHGADVISRLSFALESKENASLLKKEIEDAIYESEKILLDRFGWRKGEIIRRVLVGNTAMTHLAGGYSVKGIAFAPFTPEYVKAHETEFNEKRAILGGCISGYVGSDTISALLSNDLDIKNECALLIDIGTNGEIALVKDGRILTCSCAAGPAFEGAHIACGMGAVEGAVNHVNIRMGKLEYTTIGNKKAIGICGSGLIDIVYALVNKEEISPSGRMTEDYYITENVYLSRSDIREVQLAKSAIASGIQILLTEMGIDEDNIEKVYLAGGFGNFISTEAACGIGMLPMGLKERIIPVGNAAGAGARRMAMSERERKRHEEIRMKAEYIELASHPDFSDLFAENLLFEEEE